MKIYIHKLYKLYKFNLIKTLNYSLLTLIVMVFLSLGAKSDTNSDSKTATVHVHCPLFMDPIIPQDHTGTIYPNIIYKNGERTWVGGWYKIYAFCWVFNVPTCHPFAIFGVNGEKNAPVTLTYETHFANPTEMICNGGWAMGQWNCSQFTAQYPLEGSGLAGSGTKNVTLWGVSPTAGRNDLGGVWVGAYVSDITAGKNATAGNNQLIFTLTAAYNF